MFIEEHKKSHENVVMHNTGFFINPSVPFLGASPDGLVSCDCCGVNVIEVKVLSVPKMTWSIVCPTCMRRMMMGN